MRRGVVDNRTDTYLCHGVPFLRARLESVALWLCMQQRRHQTLEQQTGVKRTPNRLCRGTQWNAADERVMKPQVLTRQEVHPPLWDV